MKAAPMLPAAPASSATDRSTPAANSGITIACICNFNSATYRSPLADLPPPITASSGSSILIREAIPADKFSKCQRIVLLAERSPSAARLGTYFPSTPFGSRLGFNCLTLRYYGGCGCHEFEAMPLIGVTVFQEHISNFACKSMHAPVNLSIKHQRATYACADHQNNS